MNQWHCLLLRGHTSILVGTFASLHGQDRARAHKPLLDAHANNNGVAGVEDAVGQDTEAAREDGNVLEFLALRLFVLLLQMREFWLKKTPREKRINLDVGRELVEEMVDDVGCEDAEANVISHKLNAANQSQSKPMRIDGKPVHRGRQGHRRRE